MSANDNYLRSAYLPVLGGALTSMREIVTLLARHCRGSTGLNPLMNVIDSREHLQSESNFRFRNRDDRPH